MTRSGAPLAAVALAALLVACAPDGAPPRAAGEAQPVGRRIVVMAPAAAEMLAELGATSSVIAVGDYVSRPAEFTALPRVGAYDRPNIERVLSLQADLLVSAAGRAAGPAHRRLESLGVEVIALDTSTFDGIFESIERLGNVLDRTDAATALAARMHEQLASVRDTARGAPPRRVLVVVGRDPLFVAGPGSHVDELISLIGAVNVAHDTGAPWSRLSLETALERRPEVIVDASDNRDEALRGALAGGWGDWPFLPAVRDGRVFHLHPELISIPGVRLPAMARRLARLVHPERFGSPREDDFVPAAPSGGS